MLEILPQKILLEIAEHLSDDKDKHKLTLLNKPLLRQYNLIYWELKLKEIILFALDHKMEPPIESFKNILAQGVSPNLKLSDNMRYWTKDMPLLYLAVWKKWPNIVRLLLQRGANPVARHQENTPLHFAATLGYTYIAYCLIPYADNIVQSLQPLRKVIWGASLTYFKDKHNRTASEIMNTVTQSQILQTALQSCRIEDWQKAVAAEMGVTIPKHRRSL